MTTIVGAATVDANCGGDNPNDPTDPNATNPNNGPCSGLNNSGGRSMCPSTMLIQRAGNMRFQFDGQAYLTGMAVNLTTVDAATVSNRRGELAYGALMDSGESHCKSPSNHLTGFPCTYKCQICCPCAVKSFV
jgi:hypothetical protein